MIVLGLTGSIGMGKTTAANQLRSLGVPVHDADATVHRLQAKGGAAVTVIEDAFHGVVFGGEVDRGRLGARVFGNSQALTQLENILHPLVRQEEQRFLRRQRRMRRQVVALDIPLLLETQGDKRVDAVVVVTCPAFLQEQRVMRRHGMTHGKLLEIRRRQMNDADKRRRATVIVQTGIGRRASLRSLIKAVTALRAAPGKPHRSGL